MSQNFYQPKSQVANRKANTFNCKKMPSHCYLFLKSRLIFLVTFILYSNTAIAVTINIDSEKKYFFSENAQALISKSNVKDAKSIIHQFSSTTQRASLPSAYESMSLKEPTNTWFKFGLHNPTDKEIDLFFVGGDATMPWFQVNIVKNNKIILQKTGGGNLPLVEHPINHRLFLVPLNIKSKETITLIIGMNSRSMVQNVWLESQSAFWSNENLTTLTDGIYLGTVLLIGIMSALLYITDRDRLYLYIYIIIIGNTIYHFSRNGYAHQYLWPKTSGSNDDWALVTLSLSIIGGILFTVHFLNLCLQRQRWPLIMSIIYIAITLVIAASNFISTHDITLPLTTITRNLTGIFFLFMWCHSAKRSLKNDLRARVYTTVWLFYLVPYLTSILSNYQGIQNELSSTLFFRNGDIFLVLALWAALILDVRNTHLEKNAAIVESKAKSTFMATMSHELRTPLNGVIGMGELLHQTKQTPLQRQYSDIIVSSGNLLLTLINDILDLTKISDDKLEFEEKPFRLDNMLPECASSFIPEMMKKNTPLRTDMSTRTPYHLIGDEYRLRQILFNLLSNAMKFTENGTVKVVASGHATNNPHKMNLKLKVIDTGIGIEKQALEHVFDQFSQADASTTRRFGGTGLGLAITKAIIEQMSGSITVRSTLGEGSIFTVSVPMRIDCDAELQRKVSLLTLAGKRVLAIRDTAYVYDNTSRHISSWGMHMDIVVGINAAKEKLLECDHKIDQRYNIVLAYFMNKPQEKLPELQSLNKPLIIFHHAQLDTDKIIWGEKTWMLPTPVSLGKLADTFREAFIQSSNSGFLQTISEPKPAKSVGTVLVVEDNLTNQLVVKGMLKHLGIEPNIANNGQEAVDMAAQHNYDVILMDCEMPVMDGFKASSIIMKNNQRPKPYIAALTAHAHKNTEIKCKKSGIQKVLYKPITIGKLKEFFDSLYL